jgi:hypothetical protein
MRCVNLFFPVRHTDTRDLLKAVTSFVDTYLAGTNDHAACTFSQPEMAVLGALQNIFEVPHRAQELLSAEKTPTLSYSLPAYERVVEGWRNLSKATPVLAPFIQPGIDKIESYMSFTRKTRLYSHAMLVNPEMKLSWTQSMSSEEGGASETQSAWGGKTSDEFEKSWRWTIELMTKFETARRHSASRDPIPAPRTAAPLQKSSSLVTATSRLKHGLKSLATLSTNLGARRSTSLFAIPSSTIEAEQSPSAAQEEPRSAEDPSVEDERVLEDRKICEKELSQYLDAGLHPDGLRDGVDQLSYWQVSPDRLYSFRRDKLIPLCFRFMNIASPISFRSPWTFYPFRHRQFLASASFPRARKLAPCGGTGYHPR